jgi:hypothetical protein
MDFELETAKEILAEIFCVQEGEVEEMIQRRIADRSWAAERTHLADDGLWPATICLGK